MVPRVASPPKEASMRALCSRLALSVFFAAGAAGTARADQVIDQLQPLTDPAAGTLAIGGGSGSEQTLAQTLTAALDGELAALFLPVACASGRLVVEVRDVAGDGRPGATVLLRRRVPAGTLPPVGLRF